MSDRERKVHWCGVYLSGKEHFGTDGERYWWTDPRGDERSYMSRERWISAYRASTEITGADPDDLPKPTEFLRSRMH